MKEKKSKTKAVKKEFEIFPYEHYVFGEAGEEKRDQLVRQIIEYYNAIKDHILTDLNGEEIQNLFADIMICVGVIKNRNIVPKFSGDWSQGTQEEFIYNLMNLRKSTNSKLNATVFFEEATEDNIFIGRI